MRPCSSAKSHDDVGQAGRRRQRLRRELDGRREPARAHLGHHRMPDEALLVGLGEHRLELAHALDAGPRAR